MKVKDILKGKGGGVVTVRPHETVSTLAHRLKLEKIGAVVVSENGKSVDGIVSERDIVRALPDHGPALPDIAVSELMTRSVFTCSPDDGIKDIMRQMTQQRIRHIPVIDEGEMIGILSIGDVVKNRLDDLEMETNVLRDYITHAG